MRGKSRGTRFRAAASAQDDSGSRLRELAIDVGHHQEGDGSGEKEADAKEARASDIENEKCQKYPDQAGCSAFGQKGALLEAARHAGVAFGEAEAEQGATGSEDEARKE